MSVPLDRLRASDIDVLIVDLRSKRKVVKTKGPDGKPVDASERVVVQAK